MTAVAEVADVTPVAAAQACQIVLPQAGEPASTWPLCGHWYVTGVYQFACVHEHVTTKAVCYCHEPGDGAPMFCDFCFDAGCVDCPMTARLVSVPS